MSEIFILLIHNYVTLLSKWTLARCLMHAVVSSVFVEYQFSCISLSSWFIKLNVHWHAHLITYYIDGIIGHKFMYPCIFMKLMFTYNGDTTVFQLEHLSTPTHLYLHKDLPIKTDLSCHNTLYFVNTAFWSWIYMYFFVISF